MKTAKTNLLLVAGIWFASLAMADEASPTVPQSPPARVKLTGIAVLPPDKWVILEITEYGQPEVRLALTEGSRRLSVRVVKIDSQVRWAIIRCGQTDMKFTIESPATLANPTAELGGEHRPLPLLPPPGAGDP